MSRNFMNSKIYKITNDFNNEVYIGSTCNALNKRFSQHKCNAIKSKTKQDYPLYKLMNEIGSDRFRMDLIEEWEAKDKQEIRQKEGKYIRDMGTINKRVAGRTIQEYQEDNKEKYQEIKKKSAEKHKEANTIRKKQWYEDNKQKVLEKGKMRYEMNKEEI